jgi:hypothetical protein
MAVEIYIFADLIIFISKQLDRDELADSEQEVGS